MMPMKVGDSQAFVHSNPRELAQANTVSAFGRVLARFRRRLRLGAHELNRVPLHSLFSRAAVGAQELELQSLAQLLQHSFYSHGLGRRVAFRWRSLLGLSWLKSVWLDTGLASGTMRGQHFRQPRKRN